MACILNASTSSGLVTSADTSGELQFQSNGVQIGTLCRAWVNFNGTGTVAIRASFNVSSITDNGTGDYTVNFTNAFADANYAVKISQNQVTSGWYAQGVQSTSTTNVRVSTRYESAQLDVTGAYVTVFR